eukprot:CAMPEP_0168514182 /NCGR_PEP_ID=MMETSP0405-20121227/3947_1 /TAXON_ID=498012 /ORGANISM="Trichosphaerium sp, Strain Am-I-7 wt" /LENGTH=322 /DNA_ID=CAMNT_0008533239 /DNA_START=77 /DNA_END=1045 /DNA_ORIENTATION=-
MYQFRTQDKYVGIIMDELSEHGVGVDFGVVDILPLSSTKPRLSASKVTPLTRKKYKLSERVSIEEIYETVDSQLHLTFDYLAMTLVASIIAGAGLATDSSVSVVASMIVSPLMGPITALTFGTVIQSKTMVYKGFRNEFYGLALTFLVGFIFGIVLIFTNVKWPTYEMTSRGTLSGLWGGIVVAIPSGVGVALAITGPYSGALVGIAISAALLPPVVNSGMNLAYGLMAYWLDIDHVSGGQKSRRMAKEWLMIAMYSFILFLLNWVCIYLAALLFFKIKQIRPDKHRARRMKWRDLPPVSHPSTILVDPLSASTEDVEGLLN